MGNLDILSRTHRNDEDEDEDTDLGIQLPSWVPPFHRAGSTSLIDELLVTKYDAAKYITYELLSHIIERSNNIISLFKELENIRIDA
jgi:hypothetical protein